MKMKPVKHFEEFYSITEDGRVFSHRKNKYLKNQKTIHGYYTVHLCKQKSVRWFPIHRIVALTYIPNPDNKPQVNHKNGIKTDNRVENLEWCTNQENVLHSFRSNHREPSRMLAVIQKDLQGNKIRNFVSQNEASRETGVPQSSISKCLSGKIKQSHGFCWSFLA